MQSSAKTVSEYLKSLSADRRKEIEAVRKIIRKNLPQGYQEAMQYGMIGYSVPLKDYPAGYLEDGKTPLPYVALASQKNHLSLYLMAVYDNPNLESWFRREYKASGKKLDMGKSCVRFKSASDLPLDLIGKTVGKVPADDLITWYESTRRSRKKTKKS